ncbi:MAG: hypothetical protein ABI699_05775 [Caldimonas sp.]
MFRTLARTFSAALGAALLASCASRPAIDNGTIGQPAFREHKATYGLVYRLPREATDLLDARIAAPLKNRLLALGLRAETQTFNLPHVTVVHIHSADPGTPQKMLKALPKLPPVIAFRFKDFYTTEAAKDAGRPWWLDLGIVKTGQGYEDLMAFNTVATAALAPLRDGPLPRVTGPVYEKMSDAGKLLVASVGVSGVNVVRDGKELRSHNPHNTLVYSMAPFDARVQAGMKELAAEFNKVLPEGFPMTFREVSIVELAFSGNVLREFYRINLENGSAVDAANGQPVTGGWR